MRKWISGLLAGLLIVIVSAGCGKAPAVSAPPDSSEGGVLTLPIESEASTTQPPMSNENLNPLTGKSDLTKGGTRPVGVMIGNNSTSRPQHGIDKADLYVEAETEGGSPGFWPCLPMRNASRPNSARSGRRAPRL